MENMDEKIDIFNPKTSEGEDIIETPKAIEVTAEELAREKFNPIFIGQKVLERFGYEINIAAFGYNSLFIKVSDKDGNVLYEEYIGL